MKFMQKQKYTRRDILIETKIPSVFLPKKEEGRWANNIQKNRQFN